MMRKMLRTVGSKPASVLSNFYIVVSPSSPDHLGVEAPRPAAGACQVQVSKTVQDRKRAAVDQRIEILGRVRDEIGKRHLAGNDKGRRACEQPEDQQRAADQF